MSKFRFGKTSRFNLYGEVDGKTVNVHLQTLCEAVLKKTPHDFMIVDGVRTYAEQVRNVAKGFSKTMKSKHLVGRAIDFAPCIKAGIPDWQDLGAFKIIGGIFKQEAKRMNLDITWGGDWPKFRDWGHIQLNK